jgi:hypothetical protein
MERNGVVGDRTIHADEEEQDYEDEDDVGKPRGAGEKATALLAVATRRSTALPLAAVAVCALKIAAGGAGDDSDVVHRQSSSAKAVVVAAPSGWWLEKTATEKRRAVVVVVAGSGSSARQKRESHRGAKRLSRRAGDGAVAVVVRIERGWNGGKSSRLAYPRSSARVLGVRRSRMCSSVIISHSESGHLVTITGGRRRPKQKGEKMDDLYSHRLDRSRTAALYPPGPSNTKLFAVETLAAPFCSAMSVSARQREKKSQYWKKKPLSPHVCTHTDYTGL